MPPLWDVCRLFVAVGLVRLISQGHGHCDVAAALLERKADKAECGPSSSCKSNDLSGWTVSALLSFPHPNDENLHGHHITIHHNPYWVYGISDQSNTCRHVKSVSRQTSTTEAAHNWLPYPQLAREVAPWMQAAAGCSRLQAAGCGERSRTVRWDPKVRVAHGCFCKLLLIATRLDWGTWEPEGQRRSEKASWSFHNFHACAPLVNNHWFDAWRQARGCSMLAVAARCTAPDQGGANAEWQHSPWKYRHYQWNTEILFNICQNSVRIPLFHRHCVCAAQQVNSIEALVTAFLSRSRRPCCCSRSRPNEAALGFPCWHKPGRDGPGLNSQSHWGFPNQGPVNVWEDGEEMRLGVSGKADPFGQTPLMVAADALLEAGACVTDEGQWGWLVRRAGAAEFFLGETTRRVSNMRKQFTWRAWIPLESKYIM